MEGARSRFELSTRTVADLEERRDVLRLEIANNAKALPGLEKKKRVSVGSSLLSLFKGQFVSFRNSFQVWTQVTGDLSTHTIE